MMQHHTGPRARFAVWLAILLGSAMALAGCEKKVPEGQVVAVVDGEEVTRRELAAEPDAARLPEGSGNAPLAMMLNGVIDRKLAAAQARELALDRSPEYLARSKRLEEVMLSRTLFDRWVAQMPAPDQRTVSQYIASNPQKFAGRKVFLVDRIEAAAPKGQAKALAPLQSNDAIAAYLKSQEQPFRRDQVVLDSATVPAPLYRRLLSAAPGYPLALVQGGRMVVLAVIQARDAPLAQAEASQAAITGLQQEAVQRKLAELRRKATIAYQPGYRPPASSPSRAREPIALQ